MGKRDINDIRNTRSWPELYRICKELGIYDRSMELSRFIPVRSDDFKRLICTQIENGYESFFLTLTELFRSGDARTECVVRERKIEPHFNVYYLDNGVHIATKEDFSYFKDVAVSEYVRIYGDASDEEVS